ncbi:TIGR01777 family protein [Virgibacillus dokdonensis]|uniref:TIGR01777 family protein n=1 Tax=Virgibacillus dokdonensis TaxID=302167 RepID=A0A3E0WST2_9BACI|nr:TIGR01777 family oxidoreductase [Virgibacillus dokdonensis]RFA36030.1 TIGR01777 family protein [Virgibacillus dokdonensis]
MNVLITGGTGFIGQALTDYLCERDYHVYVLTRSPQEHTDTNKQTFIGYDYPIEQLPPIKSVINLAGESLFGYWTKTKKESILSSRIQTTEKILAFMEKLPNKPDVFISGSAVGYYGTSNDLMFSENTTTPGDDFLAKVTTKWENVAKQAEKYNIRTVLTRFGVVLGNGGALPMMRFPVQLGVGGKIGSGEQWISWIHIEDAVKLIIFCMENKAISGPVNITAPHPKQNKAFMQTLAKVLKRPYWFPVPSIFMYTALGEMAGLITKGQYVIPQKALDHSFTFSFPYLQEALHHLYHK